VYDILVGSVTYCDNYLSINARRDFMIEKERKEAIERSIMLLKFQIEEQNLFLSFDVTEKSLVFVDREAYLKESRFSGFGIPLTKINQISKETADEKAR
jgi:hypothetical protein